MSDEPKRIQLRRTKGWRKPEGAVVVARPTRWCNPFVVESHPVVGYRVLGHGLGVGHCSANPNRPWTKHDAALVAVDLYRDLITRAHMSNGFLADLAGRDLACWCPLDQPCHADVLLELANPAPVAAVPGEGR